MLLTSAPLLKIISMGTVGERSGVFGFTMSAGLASFYRNSFLRFVGPQIWEFDKVGSHV